jgi:hypothetical protein
MGQRIHTFSRCPASVACFAGEAELNPSRVVVGVDATRRDATASAQHNGFEWAACSTRTGDLRSASGQQGMSLKPSYGSSTAPRSVKVVSSQEAVCHSNQPHNTQGSSEHIAGLKVLLPHLYWGPWHMYTCRSIHSVSKGYHPAT